MTGPAVKQDASANGARSQSTALLDGSPLVRVGARPGLFQYIKSLWKFRHFLYYDSHSRVASSNATDSLGRIWMVVNPILFGFAYFFVFGIILETSRGVQNFVGYLIIGVFMFRFFTSAITGASQSISGNQRVVQAFNFPRAALPISSAIRELFANVPVFVVMAALVFFLGDVLPGDQPITLSWSWLLFFPCLALALMVMTGVGLALARAVNAYTDVKHAITFVTRILFYTSAVFFSIDRWAAAGHDWIVTVTYMNPLYCTLDIIRHAWLYNEAADPLRWIVLGSWAVGSLVIGFIIFWLGEETYGRER